MSRFRWVAEGMNIPMVETESCSYDSEPQAIEAARRQLGRTPQARGGRFRITLFDATTREAKSAIELSVGLGQEAGA